MNPEVHPQIQLLIITACEFCTVCAPRVSEADVKGASELADGTPRGSTVPPPQDGPAHRQPCEPLGRAPRHLHGPADAARPEQAIHLPRGSSSSRHGLWETGKGVGESGQAYSSSPKLELFRKSRLHLLPPRSLQLSLPPLKSVAVKLRPYTTARGSTSEAPLAQGCSW